MYLIFNCQKIISFAPRVIRGLPTQTRLTLSTNSQLLRESDLELCAVLGSTDTEVLELFRREGVEFDLLWVPDDLPNTTRRGTSAGVLWVTLYGDMGLAADLGEVLQNLGIYLQEPIYALRDVQYWNPHKFHNDANIRTSHLRKSVHIEGTSERIDAAFSTLLAEFVSEDALPETEGCPLLLTSLKG